ncbi:MAG: hypothetical protein NTV97_13000 [Alphaproteobacteria bacterium]|nr:hypothetical protein [Alphaproteobacteria bacterium]
MGRTILLLMLLAASSAWAQSPEERAYLAERDRAITALEKKYDVEEYKRVSDALEARLRRIVGPVAPPRGFALPGHFSPDTLCCGVGAGKLDGIAFAASDDTQGTVIVTTESLLLHWLGEQKMPTPPESALRSGGFYTKAIVGDAAVDTFAFLPIAKPASATVAVAALALASQGGALWPPREIAVSVLKGGKAYVAFVEAKPLPEPIAACEAVLEDFQDKTKAMYAAGKSDDASRIAAEGETAYVDCWRTHAKDDPAFPGFVRQAQALADALVGE